jgi:branched-chain amino acid transport system permease protein
MQLFLQLMVNAVVAGSMYALLAVSFGLILGTTRTFHFAHGVVYTTAAYATYLFADYLGLPLLVSAALAIVVAALLGVAIEIVIYQPLRELYATPLVILISSLGVLIVIENIIAIVFSTDPKTLSGFPNSTIIVGGVAVTTLRLTIVAVSAAIFLLVLLFLFRTRVGKAMRAVANSPEVAQAVGIDKRYIFILAFALGSAVVSPAAILFTLDKGATPDIGMTAVLIAAISVIVGGLGSIPGAVLGGLIIGFAQNLGVWLIPSEWQSTIAFGVLLVVIIFRPTGLMGGKLHKAEI